MDTTTEINGTLTIDREELAKTTASYARLAARHAFNALKSKRSRKVSSALASEYEGAAFALLQLLFKNDVRTRVAFFRNHYDGQMNALRKEVTP